MPEHYLGTEPQDDQENLSPRGQPENEPPAEVKGPVWEEKFFPVTSYANGDVNTFGIGVVARPEAFLLWARK